MKTSKWSIAVIGAAALIALAPVGASAVVGNWTGYAFGNQYGSGGPEMIQGYAANHYYYNCPSDPAAPWNWGVFVYPQSPFTYVVLHDANGAAVWYGGFYIWDSGDPYCVQGNYWVDVYFGRYTPDYIYGCNCPGSPPGLCYFGWESNCQDATNWGRHNGTSYGHYG